MDSELENEIQKEILRIKEEEKRKIIQQQALEKIKQEELENSKKLNIEKYNSLSNEEKEELHLTSYDYLKYKKQIDDSNNILITLTQRQKDHSIKMIKCLENRNIQFKSKYNYILNIINEINLEEKSNIAYQNHLNKIEEIKQRELREKLEQEQEQQRLKDIEEQERIRKIKEEQEKLLNERFEEFVRNKGIVADRNSCYRNGYSKGFSDLEKMFGDYLDLHNGFSKCPTCDSKPKINRTQLCGSQGQHYNIYIEGLNTQYNNNGCWYQFLPIQSLNCCEWLYEFDTQKKYILSEKVKYITKEKIKFNTIKSRRNEHRMIDELRYGSEQEKYYWDEYTEYNPEDPTGEKSLREKEIFDTQDKIRLLKEQLASEESKLSSL